MDSLVIEATEDSPSIIFDITSNRFIISGQSRPENPGKLFIGIIDWLVNFEKILFDRKQKKSDDSAIVFVFQLEYFNSASAKYLMDVFLTVKEIVDKGYPFNIEWHYDKRDDDMLDVGKEFSELVDLEFNFVEF